VLLYYQRRHAAAIFLENYFAVPRAVASGFQNTWWPSNGSGARTFYAMPAVLIVLAVLALWRLPSLTLQPLDAARARFLGFVSVQLMCYEVALLRSDPEHLQNTMIALPFLLVLAAIDLPQWLATTSWRPGTVRVVVIAVALIVLPAGRLLQARAIFGGPAARFVSAREPLPPSTDARIAYARATPRLTDEPLATGYDSLGMREWLDFATDVHTVVGSRKTYVADVGGVWTGPLYFFADLTPAPYPLDRDTMTLNRTLLRRVAAHIGAHPDEYECFIGSELDAPDAQAFLRGHPAARRIDRLLKDRTIHILLAPSTGR
jgi:hypothetical protein